MPERFEYPEQPWSQGKMRMARTARPTPSDLGAKEFRELEGVRRERIERLSDLFFAPKNKPFSDAMKSSEAGFITTADHPDLQSLGDMYDIQPMNEMDGHVLVKPKKAEGPGPMRV